MLQARILAKADGEDPVIDEVPAQPRTGQELLFPRSQPMFGHGWEELRGVDPLEECSDRQWSIYGLPIR